MKILEHTSQLAVLKKIPEDVLSEIKKEVYSIQNDFDENKKVKFELVGHIQKEYQMNFCIEKVQNWILNDEIIHSFENYINYKANTINRPLPLYINSMWVNFQKKHEFNPTHKHSGVMSFVIWLKIPYDIKKEFELFQDIKTNHEKTSCFEFSFVDAFGKITSRLLPVDKNWEGVICLFPSELNHTVYPFFTSDEYRISVAGNIFLKA
jgi:hypothetical protein